MMNKIEEFNVDEYIDKVTETKRIFRQSLEKYGKEPQCRQLMEECAELIKATNKMLRYADRPAEPEYYANLIEEIADVEIMLYQLKVMFNVSDDEVFKVKIQKAKREQEMFESMGFKKEKFDYFGLDRFVYKKPIVDEGDYLYTFVVLFDKEEKITSVYCDEYSEDYEYGYDAPPAIDMELLKAINQQVKELGWLDE